MPESYPEITPADINKMRDWSYNRIALHVLGLFVGDDIPEVDLTKIISQSYTVDKFGSLDITPIQPIAHRVGLLRLSNGPTLAFKDVALQLLANLMDYVLEQRDEYLNILGATSGDTGSAAEEACRGKNRLRIFMLSPHGRMTPFQQKQMYTIDDPRIFNLVPDGNFDDCQAAVKLVNGDADFKADCSIGAVNSINWARIVAQVVYYVYGYTRMIKGSEEFLTVAVPSGNFGNALAAYVAGKMGLRMRIVVASNENDVLHQFFKSGVYRVREGDEVKATYSPSMDIASASNFERFMFDRVDRDPKQLKKLWNDIASTRQFHFGQSVGQTCSNMFISSGTATDDEVIETIRMVFNRYGIIVDPHTAVAMKVGFDQYSGNGLGPMLFAETAQPWKFEEAIEKAIGLHLGIPPTCGHILNGSEKFTRIEESDPSAIAERVKSFIIANVV